MPVTPPPAPIEPPNEEELRAFGEWLVEVHGLSDGPVADYKSRVRRFSKGVNWPDLTDGVQANIRTALRRFEQFRNRTARLAAQDHRDEAPSPRSLASGALIDAIAATHAALQAEAEDANPDPDRLSRIATALDLLRKSA